MIPDIYKDMYNQQEETKAARVLSTGKVKGNLSVTPHGKYYDTALKVFETCKNTLHLPASRAGFPLNRVWHNDQSRRYVESSSVFKKICAIASMGLLKEASSLLDKIHDTDMLKYRTRVSRASWSFKRLIHGYTDGLPIKSIEAEKGKAVSTDVHSDGAFSCITALAYLGLDEKAHQLYESLSRTKILHHDGPKGFPIERIKNDGEARSARIYSQSLFSHITALSSLDMSDKAHELYEAAKETPLLIHRDDGLPTESINAKGSIAITDLNSPDVFSYIKCLCDLGKAEEAAKVYETMQATSLLTLRFDSLPIETIGLDGLIKCDKFTPEAAYSYIIAMTALHDSTKQGGGRN